ncbi:helix-turn-helix domain-containing protein, partial [Pseudarthrobacter sp. AL07]|uniref:helix-turn-helix domain-containing protein n=1 Tax=unclassified Pseudarthrobacter TaxID=2647000 RepID=UPI00249B7699
ASEVTRANPGYTLHSEEPKNAQEKLVDRIAAGRVAGGHDLERRTERLGLNFDARHTVVICLRGVLGTGNGHQPLQAVAPVDRLKLAFELSCEELRLPMISQTGRTLRVRGVVGLSTAEDVETLQRLGILIRQKLSGIGHGVRLAAIGLARHGDQPWELREAFEGAQRAALVSEVVGGAARWADKLGSLGILAEGVTHSDEVSRPLINDETAKFLQAMLESGWNKAYAATSLHVQRQTIYRRLESISSSVGLDLQTPEGQLEASLLFWSHRISKLVSADGNRWLPPC